MKTIFLTSILAALLSVTSLTAAEPTIIVYNNIETVDKDQTKKFISYNQETSEAINKVVYKYDLSGKIENRTTYRWNKKEGWVAMQKYDYMYNNNDQINYIVFTKWDNKSKSWENNSNILTHLYNKEGKLIAVNQISTNNTSDFIAKK